VRFPAGLRALNHADYRRFYVGQCVSQVGSWMQSVGQAWLVLQLTGSPLRLGLIGTLQFAPVLLFSLFTGALADRLPKRRVLLCTQVAIALLAIVLGFLVRFGHVEYWHVCVLAFVRGCVNTIDMPTRQSFVAELVGKDDIVNAVALNSAAFNTARIVGPVVAGLLIARFGVDMAFILNGLSFAVVISALSRMRTEGMPRGARGRSVLADVAEGLRYALDVRRIRLLLLLLFVVSLTVFNFSVYVPLLARTVLHMGAEGFGFLMAAAGVGAVTGALALGNLRQPELALPTVLTSGFVACGSLVVMSTVTHFWVAVPMLFLIGVSGIVLVASCNTALQLAAPDHLRGRVMSLYTLIFGGSFPIGAFLVGWISERAGVSTAYLAAGVSGLAGLALITLWWRSGAE
jgi:predicted MFS family arabinose efflux permease